MLFSHASKTLPSKLTEGKGLTRKSIAVYGDSDAQPFASAVISTLIVTGPTADGVINCSFVVDNTEAALEGVTVHA